MKLLMYTTDQQIQTFDRKTGRKRFLILMEAFPPTSEMTVTNHGQLASNFTFHLMMLADAVTVVLSVTQHLLSQSG